MTPAAADWVYEHVLTQRYKESAGAIIWTGARENRRDEGKGAAFLATCACQYGPCGWCSDGRHDRCAHKGEWRPPPSPATWMQDKRGMAIGAVWMTGKPCQWSCSCDCPAPVPPPVEQLALVGEVGRVKVLAEGGQRGHAGELFGQMSLFDLAGGAR